MLKFILATIILVSFSIDALEINYEDGALVDDFVDEYPAIRELDVDQEDDDQLLPEKVTRAASWKLRGGKRFDESSSGFWKLRSGKRTLSNPLWKLRGGKRSANDDIKRDTLWKLRGGKRADDLYKREALWKLRTGKRGLWKLRGGKRSGT